MKLLDSPAARDTFARELERVRRWYGCFVTGYVVMPEHVHLLISEPERGKLSLVVQMLKQITSRKLRSKAHPPTKGAGRGGATGAILAGSLLRFFRLERGEAD
jgi:REP element-mobilizing transposase RayT